MGINVNDILGTDPAELQRQRYMQQMQQASQVDPFSQIGFALGRGVGNLTQGRGFFDTTDPALQRVAKIKQIQTGIAQSGETDPTRLAMMFADELAKDEELAPLSLQVRSSIKTTPAETNIGKVNPSDFTPESLKAFAASGGRDYSLLVEAPSKAKGNAVNVDLRGVISEAFAKKEGAAKADTWAKAGDTYKLSVPLLAELEDASAKANNAYFGFGARGKIGLAKAFNAIGIPISERAKDSEFLDAMSSKLVQRIAKNFPGSQAIKELEQLIKSKPNLEQEAGTFIKLLNNVTQEFKAEVIAYEKLAKMPESERYKQDFNVVTADAFKKINRFNSISEKVRNKTASAEEAREALAIKRELGL
jgi:hypothetical protein